MRPKQVIKFVCKNLKERDISLPANNNNYRIFIGIGIQKKSWRFLSFLYAYVQLFVLK